VTIEFQCPHCSKLLKTPDDKAGVRANCPGCGEIVTIPDLVNEVAQADDSFAAVAADAEVEEEIPDAGSIATGSAAADSIESTSQYDTKPCPMCGAAIKKAARRCRFCGEELERGAASERKPTKIDAGEILSHAWAIYKEQLGLVLGAIVVFWVITLGVAGVQGVIQNVITLTIAGQPGRGGNPFAMGVGVIGMTLVVQVINMAVGAYLQAGLHFLLLRVARGEKAEFVDLFSGGRFFWRFFWGTLLFQIALVLGYLFLIVPGIILSLMFWPVYYVIVDRDTGVIESLRLASEITTGNYMAAFILSLASMGLALLGMAALCVGWIFTIPLAELLFAVAYCGMNGQLPALPESR
jgi:predicted RNA-binding Zn-ribbon protein involved in translation (DUF1610 family)